MAFFLVGLNITSESSKFCSFTIPLDFPATSAWKMRFDELILLEMPSSSSRIFFHSGRPVGFLPRCNPGMVVSYRSRWVRLWELDPYHARHSHVNLQTLRNLISLHVLTIPTGLSSHLLPSALVQGSSTDALLKSSPACHYPGDQGLVPWVLVRSC
jgi:hypothetical protein